MTAPEPLAEAVERGTFLAMLDGLLKAPFLAPGRRERLAAIRREAEARAVLSKELADFVRVMAPDFAPENVPVDPRRCLAECIRSFRPLAVERSLLLREEVDPAVPASFPGDPRRLAQIVTSLLSNAMKFTTEGTVSVRLAAAAVERTLLLDVRDTGPGLDDESLRHLFEPFFQGPGIAARFGGSGLGLAVSRRLAQRMGGTLKAAAGTRGTLFRLTLPLAA